MSENDLFDINIVCKMLNTTSRALRFYEEKGIINSTTVDFSIRRHYSKEQIDHIRNVLVLRKLGLSLKSISELQTNNLDLRAAITSKRAEIYALIAEKNRELTILNETIEKIDSGEDIYKEKFEGNVALVVGGEDSGVKRLTKEKCDKTLSLPLQGKVNSLNASVALGIAAYEVVRNRLS